MLKLKYHKAKLDSGVSIATPQLFAGLEVTPPPPPMMSQCGYI